VITKGAATALQKVKLMDAIETAPNNLQIYSTSWIKTINVIAVFYFLK